MMLLFVLPAHAALVAPGTVPDPTFGPNDGNVMSLKGDKGDSGDPFPGGSFTGNVEFQKDATFNDDVEFVNRIGIGVPASTQPLIVKGLGSIGRQQALFSPDGTNGLFLVGASQSTHYNWLIGEQYNVDKVLEITPSTTVGGTTFTRPVAVFRQDGNVGIGTTGPNAMLHVNGSMIADNINSFYSGQITAHNTGGDNAGFLIGGPAATNGGGSNAVTVDYTTAPTVLKVNGSGSFVSTYIGGNVGIGATPGTVYKLDVDGKINAKQGFCINSICKATWSEVSSTPTLQDVTDKGATTTQTVRVGALKGDATAGQFNIYGNTATTDGPWLELWGKDNPNTSRKGELTLGSQGNGSVQFFNYNPVTSQWNGLMTLRPDGKVGIGTTGPGYDLDISRTGANAIIQAQTTTSGNAALSLLNNGNQGWAIVGNRSSNYLEIGNAGPTGANSFVVVNGTTGNVGIGTSTPGYKLQVNGQVKITDGSQGVNKVLTSDINGLATWAAAPSAPVSSVFGRTGAVTAGSGDYTTDTVTEGAKKYFSDTLAIAAVQTQLNAKAPTASPTFTGQIKITGGSPNTGKVLMASDATGLAAWGDVPSAPVSSVFGRTGAVTAGSGDYTTSQVAEGSNKYFTDARAVSAVSASPTFTGNVTMPGTGIWNSSGNVGIGTAGPATRLQVSGAHSSTQLRLTLPASGNGGGTGEVNLQAWVSEPGITWDGGGIGMNVTNDGGTNGFGRLNTGFGQSFIRFLPKPGIMKFYTTSDSGTLYDTMTLQDQNVTMNNNLTVAGNATASAFFYNSDRALKTDIRTIPDAIKIIEQLRGTSFTWKESGEPSYGLIAQEVEKVLPELVHTNASTGLKSVEYGKFVPFLIEAMKDQQKQIDRLQERIEQQEKP